MVERTTTKEPPMTVAAVPTYTELSESDQYRLSRLADLYTFRQLLLALAIEAREQGCKTVAAQIADLAGKVEAAL